MSFNDWPALRQQIAAPQTWNDVIAAADAAALPYDAMSAAQEIVDNNPRCTVGLRDDIADALQHAYDAGKAAERGAQ